MVRAHMLLITLGGILVERLLAVLVVILTLGLPMASSLGTWLLVLLMRFGIVGLVILFQ